MVLQFQVVMDNMDLLVIAKVYSELEYIFYTHKRFL